MLVGFLLTFGAMAVVTWAGFRGAHVAKQGAPAALAAATETAEELARLSQAMAAEASVTPRAGAMASAGLAAAEAVRAAASAIQIAKGMGEAADSDHDPAALLNVQADAVKKAAEQTQNMVRQAQEAARKQGQSAAKAVPGKSSNSANRAAAAAAAIEKAAQAVDQPAVASLHLAVAALAAADATVLAVEAIVEEPPEQLQVLDSTQRDQLRQLAQKTTIAAAQGRLSVWWQIVPYIVITTAEICISVVGLELAFTAAPAAMKSFVTACWLLTVFFANILNAQVTPLYNTPVLGFHLTPGWYFGAFAAAMIPVTLAFMWVAANFNRTLARSGQVV
jgi:hypothetical protein